MPLAAAPTPLATVGSRVAADAPLDPAGAAAAAAPAASAPPAAPVAAAAAVAVAVVVSLAKMTSRLRILLLHCAQLRFRLRCCVMSDLSDMTLLSVVSCCSLTLLWSACTLESKHRGQ